MSACFWFLRDPRKGDASKGHIHEKNVQINNHLADLVSYNLLRLLRLLYVYEQKRLIHPNLTDTMAKFSAKYFIQRYTKFRQIYQEC